MPYNKRDELPDAVQKLPSHAQDIYMSAFNSAFKQYNGDEEKCAATAWAAVKMKFKKGEDGNWVAKEVKSKEAELSAEDTRRLLQGALDSQFAPSVPQPVIPGAWIRDVYEDSLVYEQSGQSYEVTFTITDGKVAFGKPVKVMATTVYNPIEAQRQKYAELVQEASKRGKVNDPRVQKIVTEGDKSKELDSVLAWLKEQPPVKTEDGQDYLAEAFAFTPSDNPSDWKLRIWEDPVKKVTRKQLGIASAYLSPGGFRGQKVEIPVEESANVKRNIRAAYRALSVPDEDIPRWVKETEIRELVAEVTQMVEAKLDNKGLAQLVVIQPGFNSSKERYYPSDMLARDFSVFEGAKMFADHASESEERDRPERSIKDWVATLKNVRVDAQGKVIGEAVVIESWMQEKLAQLRDKGLLSEMGVSINAVGTATRSVIEGVKTNVVEKLNRVRSVDFVTWPGAGGMVTLYETDREHDVDLIGIESLKERRPDLVKQIETAAKAEITQEVKRKMELEERVKELEGQNTTLTQENESLKTKIAEVDKAKAKAEAQALIKEAVGKADLPDAAKARLVERFKDSESDAGVAEAIKAESEYILALAEAGKVKGMGNTQPEINPEKSRKELKEAFIRTGMSEKEAEIAASAR